MKNNHETVALTADVGLEHKEVDVVAPEVTMVIITWVTFFALLFILKKFAWKPILAALDEREEMIRKSVGDAEHIKNEMQAMDKHRKELIDEARDEAAHILDNARKGAQEAARVIEQQTKEQNEILLENTVRQIRDEKEKAKAELKEESVRLAVDLAEKLIEENLDDAKNKKIVNRFIKEI